MIQTAKQTKIEAYLNLLASVRGRRKQVYSCLHTYGPLTAQELAQNLGLGVNQISGRLTELQDLFLVKAAGRKINPDSGQANTLWKVTSHQEAAELKAQELRRLEAVMEALKLDDSVLFVSGYTKELIYKEKNRIGQRIKDLKAA